MTARFLCATCRVISRGIVGHCEHILKVFDHVWFWRARLPERKGQPCRVVSRGRMNSIMVEFPDGHRVITSRYAVRKQEG